MSDRTPGNAPQVLVVEDDDAIRSFIVEVLVGVGYRVVESPDGQHALARLDIDPPDVVVLDLQLPTVDGWAVLAALEEHPRKPPVVVMSAGANAKQAAAQFGAAGHLEKPFAVSALIAVVDRCAYKIAS
ncbi:MAG: hypothetical protein NVSMB8_02290 [Candidatus Limnocylindrales bacterium]